MCRVVVGLRLHAGNCGRRGIRGQLSRLSRSHASGLQDVWYVLQGAGLLAAALDGVELNVWRRAGGGVVAGRLALVLLMLAHVWVPLR